MNEEDKKKALDRWAPILDNMGVTGSRADWMSQYVHQHGIMSNVNIPVTSTTQSISEKTDDSFPSLLPMSMKIAAKTVGMDLVSVQPLPGPGGNTKEEMDRIQAEIKAENRQGKIDSVIENKEYKEKEIKDHPDYKGPNIDLIYLDFKYGSTSSSSKSKRRRGKK